MSDYLFMLENRLDAGQARVLAEIQRLAIDAGMSVWLTGGAMRDMFRGAPIRDLDFTVERDAVRTGAALAAALGGETVLRDPLDRQVELRLPGPIRASVANARSERYSAPGGTPVIEPATIHEDLVRRDFTINAIALCLNRGSRGLLVDPTNGQADVENRELRAANPYALFDDPSRVFRLFRFRHVFNFTVVPRLRSQLENALIEDYPASAPHRALAREIRYAGTDPNIVPLLEDLDSHGLMKYVHPSLTGPKLNAAGLARFEKVARSGIPYGSEEGWPAFLSVLVEKLNPREQTAVAAAFEPTPDQTESWKSLGDRAAKLEAELGSPGSHRPSQVFESLSGATTDEVLLALYRSSSRGIQDRVQAFYEKYLPMSQEVTDEQVAGSGAKPGTPRFDKTRRAMIAALLNARPKKPEAAADPDAPEQAAEAATAAE